MEGDTYELIIELKKIPDGGIVRKVSGEKRYKVRRNLKIYGIEFSSDIERVMINELNK